MYKRIIRKNIKIYLEQLNFENKELEENQTIRKIRTVQKEGNRKVRKRGKI